LFLISGATLLACSCVTLGFLIYFITLSLTNDVLALALILPVVLGCGIALVIYALKIRKSISNVSTLISLYPDFVKTESFEIFTHGFKRSELLIDALHKDFIFLIKDQIVPLYSFDDIISYNVYENGESIFEGTRKNIGQDKNLGYVGIKGGNFLSDYVKSLQVIINVKDDKSPHIIISFLGLRGVDRLSSDYRDHIKSIHKLCSKLDFMMSA
jgi:hypothetical protein